MALQFSPPQSIAALVNPALPKQTNQIAIIEYEHFGIRRLILLIYE